MLAKSKYNIIESEEELLKELSRYKKKGNTDVLDYFESLIKLQDAITNSKLEEMSKIALELDSELYNRIKNYNLYNKALKVFVDNDDKLRIVGNNAGYKGLMVFTHLNNQLVFLYNFDYRKMSKVMLFKSIIENEKRQKEIKDLNKYINALEEQENPYTDYDQASKWNIHKIKTIKAYKKRLEGCSDFDIKKSLLINKYNKLLLEEYKIDKNDFSENYSSTNQNGKLLELKKEYPGFEVIERVNYIEWGKNNGKK